MSGVSWEDMDLADPAEMTDLWRRAVAALEPIANALEALKGEDS